MFFILSINIKKNTASIVGHARTLEEAIEQVKEHSRAYVVAKNDPVLHRSNEEDKVKFTDRVHYYTKDCPERCHQIDVFRQQTKKVEGWVKNSYKDDSQLVRRFAYDEYKEIEAVELVDAEESEASEEVRALRAARAKEMGLRHTNTVGGFPRDVMTDLRESDAFKRYAESAKKNKLPPPYKHTVFVDSDDEDVTSTEEEVQRE